MSSPVLSIVVPVKDEAESIAPFVERVTRVLGELNDPAGQSFEILFIDDGSGDGTLDAIKAQNSNDRRVHALSLSRNFGKEAALSAGLDHACGSAIVPMDVDLQDPPEVLGEMLARWRDGFDVVYGVRDDRQSDTFSKRLSADLFYRAHNWLTADKIPEHAGDFRLIDRKVVDVIRSMPERNRFMKGLFAWAGISRARASLTDATRANSARASSVTGSCGLSRSTGSRPRPQSRSVYGATSEEWSRSARSPSPSSSSFAPSSLGSTCPATLR